MANNIISPANYLALINSSVNQDNDDISETNSNDGGQFFASEALSMENVLEDMKKKIASQKQSKIVDIAKFTKEQIPEAIKQFPNFKVDDFLVKTIHKSQPIIKKMNGKSIAAPTLPINETKNIIIFETRYRTPSGSPCIIDYKVDVLKDPRFSRSPWLKYFRMSCNLGEGKNVPPEALIEIVRWLQAIKNLKSFI